MPAQKVVGIVDRTTMPPEDQARVARQFKNMQEGIIPTGEALHQALTRALVDGDPKRASALANWAREPKNADAVVKLMLEKSGAQNPSK